MKIKIHAMLIIFLFVLMLTACTGAVSTPAATSTATKPAEFTPTVSMATPVSSAVNIPVDSQVYTDPDGWYSIAFSAEMKATDKPNVFSGKDGFLETGYLPKLGYMSMVNACTWLANFELKPEKSTLGIIGRPENECDAVSTDANQTIKYNLYETPTADFAHRFIYVKTVSDRAGSPGFTFSWLEYTAATKPESTPTRLSADADPFWKNLGTLPANISVAEYVIVDGNPTQQDGLINQVPVEARPVWPKRANPTAAPKQTALESLGYSTRASTGGLLVSRDNKPLFDHVFHISDVYRFSTDHGPVTAFIVSAQMEGYKDFLIQNDVIVNVSPQSAMDPDFAPILYQGDLLWAKVTQGVHVQIKRSNGDVLFTFTTYFGATLPKMQFRSWHDHWILEVGDFVIQDGEFSNQKLGFDELFKWDLLKDKPIYFFRKGAGVGISYDGTVLPLQYQEIAHGMCCSPAQNNPGLVGDALYFYGRRDGVWYYVVVKFK